MHINFTGHNIEVTQALRTFTQEKLGKLEHHFEKIMQINIVFNIEKLAQIAEGTVFLGKNEVHAHASSEDLYTSIDELIDKLDRLLNKHKGKGLEKIKEKMKKKQEEEE